MICRTTTTSLLVVGALSFALAALAPPPAAGAEACAGFIHPLGRAESFWRKAGAERVQSCIAQLGAAARSKSQQLTPLHLAALFSGNPAGVSALLQAGADSNAGAKGGFAPLHLAAQSGRSPAVVATLLEAGADPNGKTEKGFSPLHLAAEYNRQSGIVAVLLKGGADPNDGIRGGFTPLHIAAQHNRNPAVIAELVNGGARPDARTGKGVTPLHLAAIFSRAPAVVAALVKGGAEPNAKIKAGATPLHLAARRNSNPAIVMALLNGGADPKITVKGKTAFDFGRNNKKLAGSAAYRRLKDAHDKSAAARQSARKKADTKSRTPGTSKAAREPVSWRGACIVGKDLKPGEGCRIPGGGEFKVASDGCVRSIPDIPRGSPKEKVKMSMGGFSVSVRNGKSSTCIRGHLRLGKFAARRQAETSSWKIEALP